MALPVVAMVIKSIVSLAGLPPPADRPLVLELAPADDLLVVVATSEVFPQGGNPLGQPAVDRGQSNKEKEGFSMSDTHSKHCFDCMSRSAASHSIRIIFCPSILQPMATTKLSPWTSSLKAIFVNQQFDGLTLNLNSL